MTLSQFVEQLRQKDLEVNPLKEDKINNVYLHNHYREITKNSNNILCCIGDSWTKGYRLSSEQHQRVFGEIISQTLDWDWVNAGGSGYSNSWVLQNTDLIVDFLNASHYTGGVVVLTFTENGRDIKNYSNRKFNYIESYKHVPVTPALYDQVCGDIEKEWLDKLCNIRQKLDQQFRIVVGCNFVYHDVLMQQIATIPGIDSIATSWIQSLANHSNQLSQPPKTNIVNLDSIDAINDILTITDRSAYKTWYLDKQPLAIGVLGWMEEADCFFDKCDLRHPNETGHQIWANKILEIIAHFKFHGSESFD